MRAGVLGYELDTIRNGKHVGDGVQCYSGSPKGLVPSDDRNHVTFLGAHEMI